LIAFIAHTAASRNCAFTLFYGVSCYRLYGRIGQIGLTLIDKVQDFPDCQRDAAGINNNVFLHYGRPKALHCGPMLERMRAP
jgi:hypothetical protein